MATTAPSFRIDRTARSMAFLCSQRAGRLAARERIPFDILDCQMGFVATHANGCAMDFAALLATDDTNFLHDWLGIRAHLDRATGRLRNCFVPRFTVLGQHKWADVG